ncbi:MAG: hypothetical protein WC758_02340 [Candidatus Woesearchaeota archaeon]|jgi:uncharacterized membrane protein
MKAKTSLKTILVIAIAGILFSGYLSYTELFRKTCALGGSCTNVGSVPACVYGFVMYTIVLVIAILGLCSKEKKKK